MQRKQNGAMAKNALKYQHRLHLKQAANLKKNYQIKKHEFEKFLLLVALGLNKKNKLPMSWLSIMVILGWLADHAEARGIFDESNIKTDKSCQLVNRATFLSASSKIKNFSIQDQLVVDPSVYKTFNTCTKAQVDDYLQGTTREALGTYVFSNDMQKDAATQPIVMRFTSNPAALFYRNTTGERGNTSLQDGVINIALFNSPANLDSLEHHATLSTFRHEKHHQWKGIINLKKAPCAVNVKTHSWISHPFLPAESSELIKSWAMTLKAGLTRLENEMVSDSIISLYRPRIWILNRAFTNEMVEAIETRISQKRYCNLVIDSTQDGQFKEIEEVFSAKQVKINAYVYHIDKISGNRYNIFYGHVRFPEDIEKSRLQYALLWDIKGRIFQYENDEANGKGGFGRNIAEIDAFVAGLHQDVITAVFPEWVAFHEEQYQSAMRCNLPAATIPALGRREL